MELADTVIQEPPRNKLERVELEQFDSNGIVRPSKGAANSISFRSSRGVLL
jgi:hypothetical protein